MAYAFRQNQIDALIDDDGSFTVGTLFDRAWFQTYMADMNLGFRIAKTDAQPAVDIDAAKGGILAGVGVSTAPDTGFFRSAALEWRARNAADTAFAKVSGASPTDPANYVTLAYADANLANPDPLTLAVAAPSTPAAKTLYADSICFGWANIEGDGTSALVSDVNVSSFVDLGPGNYRLVFATGFNSAQEVIVNLQAVDDVRKFIRVSSLAAGQFEMQVEDEAGSDADSNVLCSFFGRQV